MAGSNLPDADHFVKFFKNREMIRENGVVIGVHPFAFELRAAGNGFDQEKTLSGVHYEWCEGSPVEMITACFHFINMEIKKKDSLVRMNVGEIKSQGKKRSKSLRVRNEPDDRCPPYSEIFGLPVATDEELCALLAADPVKEIVEVINLL